MKHTRDVNWNPSYMDKQRKFDRKMKRECIGGVVVMAAMFLVMFIILRVWE